MLSFGSALVPLGKYGNNTVISNAYRHSQYWDPIYRTGDLEYTPLINVLVIVLYAVTILKGSDDR